MLTQFGTVQAFRKLKLKKGLIILRKAIKENKESNWKFQMFGRISVNKVIKHNGYYSKESTK